MGPIIFLNDLERLILKSTRQKQDIGLSNVYLRMSKHGTTFSKLTGYYYCLNTNIQGF